MTPDLPRFPIRIAAELSSGGCALVMIGTPLTMISIAAAGLFVSKGSPLSETLPVCLLLFATGGGSLLLGIRLCRTRGCHVIRERSVEFYARQEDTKPAWVESMSSYKGVAMQLVLHPASGSDIEEHQVLLLHASDKRRNVPFHLWERRPHDETEARKRASNLHAALGPALLEDLPAVEIQGKEIPLGPFRIYIGR